MSRRRLTLATNNGDIGGGEEMLLRLADAARELGAEVCVVGPAAPRDVVTRAAAAGHETVVLEGTGRRGYLRALRRWDRVERRGLLWCNGLVPATATTGSPGRVVHLHQRPSRRQDPVRRVAVAAAEAVVVPSHWLAGHLPGAAVLPNWTADLDYLGPRTRSGGPVRVGFLGRLTAPKGVAVLGQALGRLVADGTDLTLVLAGEPRFGDEGDAPHVATALAPLAERTERLGWVRPTELLAQVDLAVFPSVAAEAFGLVAAEAMAVGTPFVVSDAGALPEVCGPDHPWVARRGDADDLAAVVSSALRTLPTRAEEQAKALRSRWEQHFSPVAGRERLAELLHRLGVL